MLDALLPIDEVRRIVGGKSRRTIYRWIGEGLFPKPIGVGPNSVAWPESTIREFIESKKRERLSEFLDQIVDELETQLPLYADRADDLNSLIGHIRLVADLMRQIETATQPN